MGGGEGYKGPDELDQAMEGFDQVQSVEQQARPARPKKPRTQLVVPEEETRIKRVFQRHLDAEG